MKKLLFFICLSCLLTLVSTPLFMATTTSTTKESYIEVNIGDDSMLEEDGLTKISGTVDFNKIGDYIVTYADDIGNTVKKTVHIISPQENYLIKFGLDYKIDIPKDNEIVDIKNIDEKSFYLICNYILPDPTAPDQQKINIMYYENNKFMWEYHYFKYSRYISSVLVNDRLMVSGEVFNEDNNYITSICLIEVTKNREISKLKEIKTDKSCTVKGMYFYDDYLYLVTNTSGTTLDYKDINTDGKHRLIFLKLSYKYFTIQSFYTFDNLDNFVVHDANFYNNRITCHVSFKDKVEINGVKYTDAICEINSLFTTPKVHYFDLQYSNYISYIVTQNTIYYIGKKEITDEFLQVINISGSVKNKVFYLDQYSKFIANNASLVCVNIDTFYLSLSYSKASTNHFIGYCKLNGMDNPKYFNSFGVDEKNFKTTNYKDQFYKNYYKDGKIYTKKVNILEFFNEEIKGENFEINKNSIIVNGIKLEKINKSPYPECYGIYQNNNEYRDHMGTKYYLKEKIKINPITNIRENEVYQSGLTVKINGEATLNGKEINDGYIINDIGKYLLVIKGKNTPEKVINFEISDLTVKNKESEKIDFTIKNENIYKEEIKLDNDLPNAEVELNEISKDSDILYFSIAILIVGTLAFIFLRKKI